MFKDESIFQGVLEFDTPLGKLRAIEDGPYFRIYRNFGDGAYVYQCHIERKNESEARCALRDIYEQAKRSLH